MKPEQQGLIEDIAVRFVQAAPENWTELRIDVSMLTSISGFAATAVDAEGNETTFFIDDTTDKKILRALGKLREDMAAESQGRGAWFIMSLRVPRDGKPYVDFDYDTKPEFGVHIGDAAYRSDLQRFPRSPEHYPIWLGEGDKTSTGTSDPVIEPKGADDGINDPSEDSTVIAERYQDE